jgi:acetolactate synthase-1/3 small subunit
MKTSDSLQRELLLVKVPANPITKGVAAKFGAIIADENDDSLSLEVVGDKVKIEELLTALKPHGIRELVQSGLVALERGASTLADRTLTTMGTANESSPDNKTADYQN